ncbi:MAG TPA: hypothetical protein DCS78_05205, partial [Pseudoalteromonas shioyasakiensis]|nr:hypothetical protein [Pseudoalteromonas shioyasakiensis]
KAALAAFFVIFVVQNAKFHCPQFAKFIIFLLIRFVLLLIYVYKISGMTSYQYVNVTFLNKY